MKVIVLTRSGEEVIIGGVELDALVMVSDLQKEIYSQNQKLYPARQRLTLPSSSGKDGNPVVLNPRKKLSDYVNGNEKTVIILLKDLGPQVSYRFLFFCEYLGPLLIYPIFYFLPVYGERKEMHPLQTYALYYWSFHYFKRIMETFFVHRFSHATSPVYNIYRNCTYYWTFAAFIAYNLNHPRYSPVLELQWKLGFGFGLIFQALNLYCHLKLKDLRSSDASGGYQIPKGFLFDQVTCANYTTEIYQWLAFNIATQTVAGYLFLTVGTYFMYNWAIQKHQRLNKLFDGKDGRLKYPDRWVFLPPFY